MRATQTHHYRNVFNKMKFLTSLPLNPCYRPSPHCLQDPSLSMINPYRSSSPVPRTPSHYWPCLPHTHTHSLAPSLPKGGRASGCDKGASISSNLTAESHDQCPLTILTEPSPLKPTSGLPPVRGTMPMPLEEHFPKPRQKNPLSESMLGGYWGRTWGSGIVHSRLCILSSPWVLGPKTILNFFRVSMCLASSYHYALLCNLSVTTRPRPPAA